MINQKQGWRLVWVLLGSVLSLGCGTGRAPQPELRMPEQERRVMLDPPAISPHMLWAKTETSGTFKSQVPTRITIMDEGVQLGTKTPEQYLKEAFETATKQWHWNDVPYHYYIAPNGMIYQGRRVEMQGNPSSQLPAEGHILVSFMTDFSVDKVQPIQLQVLAKLCAWLACKYDIPVSNIKALRDYIKYPSPGDNLYVYYIDSGWLSREVERTISRKQKEMYGK